MSFLGGLWSVFLFFVGFEELFLADIASGFGLVTAPYKYIPLILLIAGMLSMFPLFYRIAKPRFPNPWISRMVFVSVVMSVVVALRLGGARANRSVTLDQLQMKVGHCNPHLGWLMQSRIGRSVVEKITARVHPVARYVYFLGEDLCRSRQIARIFEAERPALCQSFPSDVTPIDCFKDVLLGTGPYSNFSLMLHARSASRILRLTEGESGGSVSLAGAAEASLRLADFMLFLNKLRDLPGSPDDLLKEVKPEQRDQMMKLAEKSVAAGLQFTRRK